MMDQLVSVLQGMPAKLSLPEHDEIGIFEKIFTAITLALSEAYTACLNRRLHYYMPLIERGGVSFILRLSSQHCDSCAPLQLPDQARLEAVWRCVCVCVCVCVCALSFFLLLARPALAWI
jgi:hypothetical protein